MERRNGTALRRQNRGRSHLDIELLALRVLQEEPEGLLPYGAVVVVDSLETCSIKGTGHCFY